MRRRLAWSGVFLLAAGVVAALIVLFPSPQPPKEEEVSTIPGTYIPPDKEHPFVTRKKDVLDVASRFIVTAVQRRHVEDSWELAAPQLRAGFTREKWSRGTIPVVPFLQPIDFMKYRVGYSFEKEVDLQVALFPHRKKGQPRVVPAVFDLTVQRFSRNGRPRWLVSSFLPTPAGADQFSNPGPPQFGAGRRLPREPVYTPPHHTLFWLLVPAGVLLVLLAVLAAVGIGGIRDALAFRAYRRGRQSSS